MTLGLRIGRWAWVAAAATLISLAVSTVDDVWRSAGRIGPGPEYFNDARQYELSFSQVQALDDIGLSAGWHVALVTARFFLVLASSVVIATLLWYRARTWAPLFVAWFLLLSPMLTVFLDLDAANAGMPNVLQLGTGLLFLGGVISVLGLLLVFPDDSSAAWVIALLVAASVVPLYATATDNDVLGGWLWSYSPFVVGIFVLGGVVLQVRRIGEPRSHGEGSPPSRHRRPSDNDGAGRHVGRHRSCRGVAQRARVIGPAADLGIGVHGGSTRVRDRGDMDPASTGTLGHGHSAQGVGGLRCAHDVPGGRLLRHGCLRPGRGQRRLRHVEQHLRGDGVDGVDRGAVPPGSIPLAARHRPDLRPAPSGRGTPRHRLRTRARPARSFPVRPSRRCSTQSTTSSDQSTPSSGSHPETRRERHGRQSPG